MTMITEQILYDSHEYKRGHTVNYLKLYNVRINRVCKAVTEANTSRLQQQNIATKNTYSQIKTLQINLSKSMMHCYCR